MDKKDEQSDTNDLRHALSVSRQVAQATPLSYVFNGNSIVPSISYAILILLWPFGNYRAKSLMLTETSRFTEYKGDSRFKAFARRMYCPQIFPLSQKTFHFLGLGEIRCQQAQPVTG